MSVRLLVNREVNISRNYNLSSSIRSCIINCQAERCEESKINRWKLSIGESRCSLLRCDETENVAIFDSRNITREFSVRRWFILPDTGARRKSRGTTCQQPFPKWSDRSPDRRSGGRPKVAAGIHVFGCERRQFPGSTGWTWRKQAHLQASNTKIVSFLFLHLRSNLKIKPTRISLIFGTRCSRLRLFLYYYY